MEASLPPVSTSIITTLCRLDSLLGVFWQNEGLDFLTKTQPFFVKQLLFELYLNISKSSEIEARLGYLHIQLEVTRCYRHSSRSWAFRRPILIIVIYLSTVIFCWSTVNSRWPSTSIFSPIHPSSPPSCPCRKRMYNGLPIEFVISWGSIIS